MDGFSVLNAFLGYVDSTQEVEWKSLHAQSLFQNIFFTSFRRKICSPENHLFYLSKEMDNVLTGEVGTFDMYANFFKGSLKFNIFSRDFFLLGKRSDFGKLITVFPAQKLLVIHYVRAKFLKLERAQWKYSISLTVFRNFQQGLQTKFLLLTRMIMW